MIKLLSVFAVLRKGSSIHTRVVALFFLSALLLSSMGCGGSSNSSQDDSGNDAAGLQVARVGMLRDTSGGQFVLPWENTFGGVLGDGFNSVSESVIQSPCIEFTTDPEGSITTLFDFQVYDSYEDLATSMNASYSTKSNYGVYKNSIQASVMADMSITSNTIYAHAYYRVYGPSISVQNVKLKSSYATKTAAEIVQSCGDYYLGNISQGAVMDAVISISTTNRTEKASVEFEFKQKVANSKTDVKTRADVSKFLSEHKTAVKVITRGCQTMGPIEDLSGFYGAMDVFHTNVQGCLNNPKNSNLADQMTFYSMDPYANGVALVVQDKQKAANDLLLADFEYRKILVDIDDILDNPNFYIWDAVHYTSSQLQTTKAQINDIYLPELKNNLNVCSTTPLSCSFPTSDISDVKNNTYLKIRAKMPMHADFYPQSCNEIYRNNKSVDNGAYRIYLGKKQNRPLDVYCTFGHGGSLDYLDLPGFHDISSPNDPNFYQPGDNYSEFVNWWNYSPHKDYPDQVTSFWRVRIDPGVSTVRIILNDYSFAKTYTSPSNPKIIPDPPGKDSSAYHFPFGYADGGYVAWEGSIPNPYVYRDLTADANGAGAWCRKTSAPGMTGCGWGKAKVSVVGTPLAISQNTQWISEGYQSRGWTEFSADRKSVQVYGTGNYGGMFPYIVDGTTRTLGIELDYVGGK